MVPNKICRGQDFGGADFLLAVIAEQDFMGSSVTRSRGARTEPSTGAIWVRPVAPQAEFQGERFPGYRAPAAL